jgi:ADP-heptose:LPS heptosyltransferase
MALTNDSGPLPLATALSRPMMAIFGPTNPVWFGPCQRPDALVRAGVACSPWNLSDMAGCPYGRAYMRAITPVA